VTPSFLDGALLWLNGFLTGKTPAAPPSSEKGIKPTGGTGTGSGGGWNLPHPNTGVCIDPLGSPCVLIPMS
jgi:hypothetical protein